MSIIIENPHLKDRTHFNFLLAVPGLYYHIFKHLDAKDVCQLATVSKLWSSTLEEKAALPLWWYWCRTHEYDSLQYTPTRNYKKIFLNRYNEQKQSDAMSKKRKFGETINHVQPSSIVAAAPTPATNTPLTASTSTFMKRKREITITFAEPSQETATMA